METALVLEVESRLAAAFEETEQRSLEQRSRALALLRSHLEAGGGGGGSQSGGSTEALRRAESRVASLERELERVALAHAAARRTDREQHEATEKLRLAEVSDLASAEREAAVRAAVQRSEDEAAERYGQLVESSAEQKEALEEACRLKVAAAANETSKQTASAKQAATEHAAALEVSERR